LNKEKFLSNLSKVPVTNETFRVLADDYDKAIENYLRLIPLNRVRSIYQIGSVGIPGLSDIDLIVVLEDDRRELWRNYSINRLSRHDQYIFSHDCIITDVETFEVLPLWFPFTNLVHIWGKKTKLQAPTPSTLKINLLILVGLLLTKVPSDFLLYSLFRGQFHERVMVAMLNSLKYSLDIWKSAGQSIPSESSQFVRKYEKFRAQWFDTPLNVRREKLFEFVYDGVIQSLGLIEDIAIYISSKWIDDLSYFQSPTDWMLHTPSRVLLFTDHWNPEKALELAIDSKGYQFCYPKEMALILAAGFYKSNGLIGNHVRSNFSMTLNEEFVLNRDVTSALKIHVDALENYASFYYNKFALPLPCYFSYWATGVTHNWQDVFSKILNKLFSLMRF